MSQPFGRVSSLNLCIVYDLLHICQAMCHLLGPTSPETALDASSIFPLKFKQGWSFFEAVFEGHSCTQASSLQARVIDGVRYMWICPQTYQPQILVRGNEPLSLWRILVHKCDIHLELLPDLIPTHLRYPSEMCSPQTSRSCLATPSSIAEHHQAQGRYFGTCQVVNIEYISRLI